MRIRNIHFHDKIIKFRLGILKYLYFFSYRKNFLRTQKKKFESAKVNEPSVFEVLLYLDDLFIIDNIIHFE